MRPWEIALLAALFGLCRYVQLALFSGTLVVTCDEAQPLYTIEHELLQPATAATVTACAATHPMLTGESGGMLSFRHTRGFVCKFNLEGERKFRSDPRMACLLPVFDAVRDAKANAFVVNVLECANGTEGSPSPDATVQWHVDQTVGIWSTSTFAAHEVSVYYTSVPEDMVGGELELRHFPIDHSTPLTSSRMPDVAREWALFEAGDDAAVAHVRADKVVPRQNALVRFRGDAFHRVRSYTTETQGLRTSVVVEQYRIGKGDYEKTVEHTCSDRSFLY